ncbi:MAG: hypothetical protein QOH37_120 [Nocardioidaceae bacterium]|nr:hypothetical protein [Nocardioidaceae bacterium]
MRWSRVLLVAFAVIVINLPWALNQIQLHRAETSGVKVSAAVLSVSDAGGDTSQVDFRLPASVDPDQKARTARVDSTTADAAAASQTIDVRVLKGHPDVFHVEGQVKSWASTLITAVADLLILLMLLLSWRLGGRLRRPALEAVALGDVQTGEKGSLLDRRLDGTYLINGEIKEVDHGTLVLTLRDRDVKVHLQGHHNPVAIGEQAQVLAHLVG